MGNLADRVWELGSWRREERLGRSMQVDRKSCGLVKDLGLTEQGAFCSWLRGEVAHRKALFDSIGGHGRQI